MPKFPIGKLSQYVIRNPFTTAASVFAPLFAKNEDRGYFRTALITTPIIFAAGEFVPKMFGGVRDMVGSAIETRNLLQKSEKWTRFEQPNFNDLKTLFQTPGTTQNIIDRNLSAYLVSERKSRDFMKEQKLLSKYFNRKFVKTSELISKANMGDLAALARVQEIDALQATKGKLISNALHVARRSSLTPGEWAEIETSGILPELDNEQMLTMFQQYEARPAFRTTLKSRLKELVRKKNPLTYSGTTATSDILPVATINSGLVFGEGDAIWDAASNQLNKQAPGMVESLKLAKEQGFIKGDIVIESSKDVITGKVGKVLNVKVNRPGNIKELEIPIVDPATGQVRLFGSKQVGVGNYVIGPDLKSYRIDEWIAKQLAENPKFTNEMLQEEIAAHAYWMAGDPLDARRMGELAALEGGASTLNTQAIKMRSFGAGVTKLPLFEIEGKKLSFYDYKFGVDKKVNFIKDIINSNRYMAMGSEAGVYEGRFQLREMANLSPFGAPSAEKQDPIWRSVTKEFRLSAPEGLPIGAKPGWRSTDWEALTGSADLPGAQFNVASISAQDRTALISQLPELGRMGETGFVMNESFANNFNVTGRMKYNVDELGVKIGDKLDPNQVIGFNRADRVTPNFTGTVVDVSKTDEGYSVIMQHELAMQGAKVDIAGIKGMVPVTLPNEHFQQMRDVINKYYAGKGSQDLIPESVNVLAPAEYFAKKADPAMTYLGMSSDILRRLDKPEAAGATGIVYEYLTKLEGMGVSYNQGQLVIDAAKNQIENNKLAADRLREFSSISEDFFAKAGAAIRKAGGYQDPVLSAYVHSGKELGDWMRKNSLPAMAFAWDHSLVNVPKFSKISYDVETYMGLGGNWRGLKAMQSRLQTTTGGSPQQTREFLDYFMAGDYSKDFGRTVPLNEAFVSRHSLNEATNRAGTIFDASDIRYQDNFRLDLGGGKYLPVPGTAAYGAESNLFDPGKYHTAGWQNALQDLAYAKTPEEAVKAESIVKSRYMTELGAGKGGAFRPYQYDPLGVPGFLSNTAEQGDPFIARVSEEWVQRVHSQRLRTALMKGEDVVGLLHRQPTNELLYLKYRLDKTMQGTMDVAVPEQISRALMGDQDKDLVNSILFDANIRMEKNKLIVTSAANKMEREAAEEAIESMGDKQLQQLRIWQEIKGDEEIASRSAVDWELKSLAERSEEFAKSVEDRVGIAVNRTAGAAIGSYSNVLTGMVEQMVRNPTMMRDPALVQRLKTGLFDIRQAPISARKAHVPFSLDTAMRKITVLQKGLESGNPESAFNSIYPALLDMTETLIGKDSNEYKYWSQQGAEDLKLWAIGRSEKTRLMTAALTASESRAPKILEEVFQAGWQDVMGPIHGGATMATESASTLGMISEAIAAQGMAGARAVTGEMGNIFAKHGKGIAIGLGALAALGIVMTPSKTPIASFSRTSGNKYRPEDRMGVADNIPGEPIAGEMAPSMPPRRVIQAQQGVRTTVVAPMRQTSDLSVRMRATDMSRASETARQLAQIPGSGDTSVTINYRDHTKLRSLRTREKIREIRA